MTDRVLVARWSGQDDRATAEFARLLTDYHRQTEAEKGVPVADVGGLPERYRREVLDPRAVFAADAVLLARDGGAAVGCVVVTAPAPGVAEVKRLWVDPGTRGRGAATALVEAAVRCAADAGAGTVRLSVWRWREPAVALYGRLGFAPAARAWEAREGLVCMERGL